MDCEDVKIGMLVTTDPMGDGGILVRKEILARRRSGARGIIWTWLGGHGGDVWLILQDLEEASEEFYNDPEVVSLLEEINRVGIGTGAGEDLIRYGQRRSQWEANYVPYGFWELSPLVVSQEAHVTQEK